MEKFRTILYPYFLWPLLALPFMPFLERFEAEKHQSFLGDFMSIVTGDSGWFLFALFFALMLALLTRRLPLWACFVLSAPLSMFWPGLPHHHGINGIFWDYVFLVVGQMVGSRIELLERIPKWAAALISLALFAALGAISLAAGPQGTPHTVAIPLGLAGTAGLFLLAFSLPWQWMANSIAWVGEASLGIYLISPYAQGFIRLILLRGLHVTAPLPEILIQTVFITAVTAWIYHSRKFLHMEAFYRLPSRRSKNAGPPAGKLPIDAV